MSQKIIIFGGNGYFGSNLNKYFQNKGYNTITPTSKELDARDFSKTEKYINNLSPNIVINAAGITGRPNVDWCESHKQETMLGNVSIPLNISTACYKKGIYFIHLSSGCIYNGYNHGKGFSEKDLPNYQGSFYSITKALGEQVISHFNPLQLRIRIPIEGYPNPRNVINKLLKYKKIISEENSFTILEDFLPATEHLIKNKIHGIINMTNIGSMNHEYLMSKYKEIIDPTYNYELFTLDELHSQTKAKRSNCILQTDKREKLGAHMPPIKNRIIEILHEYKKHI